MRELLCVGNNCSGSCPRPRPGSCPGACARPSPAGTRRGRRSHAQKQPGRAGGGGTSRAVGLPRPPPASPASRGRRRPCVTLEPPPTKARPQPRPPVAPPAAAPGPRRGEEGEIAHNALVRLGSPEKEDAPQQSVFKMCLLQIPRAPLPPQVMSPVMYQKRHVEVC
ncbi:basic proline-rich protein-like [Lutra lutra]|uniref:basic proline-rich protein-like n=1 Tax=Lutra lutra TaxID=9657 RepID=UPI001FD52EDE|nr:basic proline-rich protein-like [Lutra lutra]